MDLMENPIEKHEWKKLVKQHIEIYWEEAWIEEKQVNFEIPKLATSTFWKLAPSLENSAKNSMEVKKNRRKSEITDRNV